MGALATPPAHCMAHNPTPRPCAARLSGRADPPSAAQSGEEAVEEVPFGYKNKDPWILGAGLLALGFAMYYGLQVARQ